MDQWVKLRRDEIVRVKDLLRRQCIRVQVLVQLLTKLFDLLAFFIIAEGDCDTMGASSSGTSDSVKIAFRLNWEAEVQHCLDCRYVESTRNQVRAQQEVCLASLESFNARHAFLLRHVTMHFYSFQAEHREKNQSTRALFLLIEENDRTLVKSFFRQHDQ